MRGVAFRLSAPHPCARRMRAWKLSLMSAVPVDGRICTNSLRKRLVPSWLLRLRACASFSQPPLKDVNFVVALTSSGSAKYVLLHSNCATSDSSLMPWLITVRKPVPRAASPTCFTTAALSLVHKARSTSPSIWRTTQARTSFHAQWRAVLLRDDASQAANQSESVPNLGTFGNVGK